MNDIDKIINHVKAIPDEEIELLGYLCGTRSTDAFYMRRIIAGGMIHRLVGPEFSMAFGVRVRQEFTHPARRRRTDDNDTRLGLGLDL